MINDNILSFFLGGLVVSITSYISNNVNPKLASLIWAIPISIFVIIHRMYVSGKSLTYISDFLKTTSLSVMFSMIYLFTLSKTITYTNNLIHSIVYTTIPWLLTVYVFYQIN